MARKLDWFPFYAAAFQTDEAVRLMDCFQVGCYTLWLSHQWINGSIPAEESQALALLQPWLSPLADDNDFALARDLLARCFPPSDDDPMRRQNRRLEIIRAEQVTTRERLSEAGKRGGRPKGNLSNPAKPGFNNPAKPRFTVEKSREEKKRTTSADADVVAPPLAASPDAAERETAGVAPAFAAMTQIAMRLTIAANHGLRANPALPGFNELVTSNQTAIVSRWMAEGLDVAIADRTIRDKAEHYLPKPRNPQPQSLAYFGRAVLDACDRERDRKAQDAAAAEIAEAQRHKRAAAPRVVEPRMDPAAVPDLKHLMAIEAGKLGLDCEPPASVPAAVELTAAQKRKAIQDAAEHEARMTRGTLESRGAA